MSAPQTVLPLRTTVRHALLVMAGKDYCKPRPKCQDCPLERLPHRIDMESS